MTDTPAYIKALQLKIWLSRSPEERLRRMMVDNEALLRFWSATRIIDNHLQPAKSDLQSFTKGEPLQ